MPWINWLGKHGNTKSTLSGIATPTGRHTPQLSTSVAPSGLLPLDTQHLSSPFVTHCPSITLFPGFAKFLPGWRPSLIHYSCLDSISPAMWETWVWSLGWEVPLEERGWQPAPVFLQNLQNPMDRGAWWATVHGVAESRTRLSTAQTLFSV